MSKLRQVICLLSCIANADRQGSTMYNLVRLLAWIVLDSIDAYLERHTYHLCTPML